MNSDNVQHWDDVHLLPWAEAWQMTFPHPQAVEPAPRRRRVDVRSLADVVEAMVAA